MMKKYITKQSSIKGAGKGLFTNEFFKKGEVIGLAHVDDQPASEIGRNHNHNEKNPTANNIKNGNKRYLIASRNLKPGEEITTNYRLQPELEQPEDFEKKKDETMTPQKDGYRTYSPFKNLPYIDVESDTIDSDNIVYDLKLRANNGLTKFIKKNTGLHTLPGAKVIREIPVKRKGGVLLTKKVTCKSCGWKWDAEDGGKDITTCHKCGGQGLVHAQDGGLHKFVGGGLQDFSPCQPDEYWDGEKCVKRKINYYNADEDLTKNAEYQDWLIRQALWEYSDLPYNKQNYLSGNIIKQTKNYNNQQPYDFQTQTSDFKKEYPETEDWANDVNIGPYGSQAKFIESLTNDEVAKHSYRIIKDKNDMVNQDINKNIDGYKPFDKSNVFFNKYPPSSWSYRGILTGDPIIEKFSGNWKGDDYVYKKPNTLPIEDNVDRAYLKKFYPKLTDEQINMMVKENQENPSYITNKFDANRHRKWVSGQDAEGNDIGKGQAILKNEDGLTGYKANDINTYISQFNNYTPSWPEPKEQWLKKEEKIENLPILKPSLITTKCKTNEYWNEELQECVEIDMTQFEDAKEPVEEENEIENEEEGVNQGYGNGQLKSGKYRSIDWNGIQIPYKLPGWKFRRPQYWDRGLINTKLKGKQRYINLPKIKTRNKLTVSFKKQDGGATSPEKWGQQIKDIERQIGNPSGWTLSNYNTLQNKLNEYKSWRENTPEGQAVIDTHNEEREYDIPLPEHLQDYTNAMMKARLAYANEFGNPAAERMINLPDNPYQFDNGDTGSHYMASMDNYAVPQIQDENGVLQLGDYGPESNEAIRFDSDEDANYFAENYKDVSPGFINQKQYGGISDDYIEADLNEDEIEEYRRGGYIVEEIDTYQKGGTVYTVKGSNGYYKKVNGKWQVDWNKSGKYQPLSKGDVKARTAVLDKMAKPAYDKDYDEMVAYKNLSTKDKINKFEPKKEATKEELKKISERLGRDYKPLSLATGSVNMVYPGKYLIGPGGGAIGIARNAAGLGIKGLSKAMSYIPAPVSGALNAYFGIEGTKEFLNPDSHTRKSMSRAYDDPTASNIVDAAWDVGVNSLNFLGLPFGKAIKGTKNLGKSLNSHPAGWFQSAEQKLVNPKLWKSLGIDKSGDPLGKFYDWRDIQTLKNAQNKEFKLIDKLQMGYKDEDRVKAVATIREKLGKNSFKNVQNRISESKSERSLRRSGLPVQNVRTEWGDKMGGGQGQIFLNNLNPKEVIKLGLIPGKEGTMQALVNAGNEAKTAGVAGLENVALPTKTVSFGADPIRGTEAGLQFMPWLGKPLSATNPIAIPFEYGQGSSLAKNKLLKTVEELDKRNIGIDYYGKDNIMYDPISDSYKIVDLNYTQGPGMSQHWNKLDLPVQERLESKFGKIDIKKQGGATNDYIELDLTPEEIQKYKDGGYIVEEIDTYQKGGSTKLKYKKPQGASVQPSIQKIIKNPSAALKWSKEQDAKDLIKKEKIEKQKALEKAKNALIYNEIKKLEDFETLEANELKKPEHLQFTPDIYFREGSFSNPYNPDNNIPISDNTNIYRQPRTLDWRFNPKYQDNLGLFVAKSRFEDAKAKIRKEEDSKIKTGLVNHDGTVETVGQFNKRQNDWEHSSALNRLFTEAPSSNYNIKPKGGPIPGSDFITGFGAPKMFLQATKLVKPLWNTTKTAWKAPIPLGRTITNATAGTLTPRNLLFSYWAAESANNQVDPNSDVVKSQSNFINNPSWYTLGDAAFETGVNSFGFSGIGLGKQVIKPVYNASKNFINKKIINKTIPEWLKEELRFNKLPELNNSNATEVLDAFKKRIKTPEGQKRLKNLGITNTQILDDLKIVEDENTLGQYWMEKIGLNPNLPEFKNVTRHEIEHAVRDANINSRYDKLNAAIGNFKYLFNPKAKRAAIKAAEKQTTEIDDILSGLELKKTPEKVDWAQLNNDKGKKDPSKLFDYMSDNQRATNYFDSGSGGNEKSAFAAEVQQYMMTKGIIPSESYVTITPEMVKKVFIDAKFDKEAGGKYLRLFNIMKPSETNYKLISKALNKMLGVTPIIGLGAAATQYKQGGTTNDYVEAELTLKEIKDLIAQGYVIEELN